ncbi:MAG: 1-phosphofructokinase family hexose kinase [Gordonia sp. (in: high G+C Gram-positive bacteria)]|uniref:1-phosphofructokinase family hexose kinase n=1 Tax=Gordonia sp. (in: high G+C Gram-positive bacteria) TaxID=84139 RepID=UPI0039E3A078
MIVTVTANPSVDRTIELDGTLVRGEVQRAARVRRQPGGKGINVARAVAEAGLDAVALLPARADDPLLTLLDETGLRYRTIPVEAAIRTNLTIAEPDGTTTKLNEPGAELSEGHVARFTDLIADTAADADWVALCGSLPPGVSAEWYGFVVERLHANGKRIAVDTSGAPLSAIVGFGPDLLKPNAFELAELTGGDGAALESAAEAGDLGPAVEASRLLAERTGGAVLTTLGAAGALLTDAAGTWFAQAPAVQVRSTVGAGDSSLAGYLIAGERGASPAEALACAVAYGSAAASLPGTTPPRPSDLNLAGVDVRPLS